MSSAPNPVVPTTACTPLLGAPREVVAGGVDHGEVDRDLGAGVGERVRRCARPACRRRRRRAAAGRCPRGSGSTAATSSSSGSSSTARHTVAPMRPPAPNTPTLIIGSQYRCARITRSARSAAIAGPDDREGARAVAEHAVDDPGDVVGGDRLDLLDHLVERRDLAHRELAATDAVHPARRALERQRERPGEVTLGAASSSRSVTPPSATSRSSSPSTTSSISSTRSGAVPQ